MKPGLAFRGRHRGTIPLSTRHIGPGGRRAVAALFEQVRKGFQGLGLDAMPHLREFVGSPTSALERKASIAGVWFGGKPGARNDPAHVKTMRSLIEMGASILPVVPSLEYYHRRVPQPLDSLNGYVQSDARITANVLKAFGPTRETRQAFLSYRRIDSERVARQLFHTLSDRGYRVFLDTVSVEQGASVQEALMERLADNDLVILLDSPNVLAGPVEILKQGRCIGTAHPVPGLPSAWVIFERENEIGRSRSGRIALGKHRLVYDGLGIGANRLKHLEWLNSRLCLRTLKAQLLKDWLK